METAVGLLVLHQAVALLVVLPRTGKIRLLRLGEVVAIDKIVPRVVRRVDINHLDLPRIGLLQALEDIEVIALDIEVAGGIEIDTLLPTRTERGANRDIRQQLRLALIGPRELVTLLARLDKRVLEFLTQGIEIDRPLGLAVAVGLRYTLRKKFGYTTDIRLRGVLGLHCKFGHIGFLFFREYRD